MEDDEMVNTSQVYKPNYKEFENVGKYIQKIQSEGAAKFGVCKIKPPDGWSHKNDIEKNSNLIVTGAIRQRLIGKGGIFTHTNVPETDSEQTMQLAEFKGKIKDFKEEPCVIKAEKYFWSNNYQASHKKSSLPLYGPSQDGTLFKVDEDVWNLQKLGSFLDILNPMKGIQSSYTYYGSPNTFFPFHTEDGDIGSINFNHHGAAKIWYSILREHNKRFEALIAKFYPAESKCPGFMRHKQFLVSPHLLEMNGIKYYRTVQREGEIVVTFPYGYHGGFNQGFNIAEACNFADESFIDFGKKASPCICWNPVPLHINVDPFVKIFQPKQYNAWRKYGKDSCELDYNQCPPPPDGNYVDWPEKIKKLLEEYNAKRPGKEAIGILDYLKLEYPADDPGAVPYIYPAVECPTIDNRLYAAGLEIQTRGNSMADCKKLFGKNEESGKKVQEEYGKLAPYCSMCHIVVRTKTLSDISDSPFQENKLIKDEKSRFYRSKVHIPECSFTMSKEDVDSKDVYECPGEAKKQKVKKSEGKADKSRRRPIALIVEEKEEKFTSET